MESDKLCYDHDKALMVIIQKKLIFTPGLAASAVCQKHIV